MVGMCHFVVSLRNKPRDKTVMKKTPSARILRETTKLRHFREKRKAAHDNNNFERVFIFSLRLSFFKYLNF